MQTFSSAASRHKHSNPDVTLSHYVCGGFLHLHAWFSCWFHFFLMFLHFFSGFEIFWDILRYFEIFWAFEIFWDILRFFEIFFKNYFEIFWDILRLFEIFWDILKYFEIFRDILSFFEIYFENISKKWEKCFFFGPIPNSIFSSVQLNFQLSNSTFNCPIKFSIVQLN